MIVAENIYKLTLKDEYCDMWNDKDSIEESIHFSFDRDELDKFIQNYKAQGKLSWKVEEIDLKEFKKVVTVCCMDCEV